MKATIRHLRIAIVGVAAMMQGAIIADCADSNLPMVEMICVESKADLDRTPFRTFSVTVEDGKLEVAVVLSNQRAFGEFESLRLVKASRPQGDLTTEHWVIGDIGSSAGNRSRSSLLPVKATEAGFECSFEVPLAELDLLYVEAAFRREPGLFAVYAVPLKIGKGSANQALQTTPMTRSVYEKTIEFGRPKRGV